MDRLTYFEHGKNRLLFEGTEYSNACVDRLSAYEDTGLTPEEITPRLRVLAEADRDGRVVVLPNPLTATDVEAIKDIGRIVNNLDTMAELVKKKEKRHDRRRSSE